MKKKLARSRLGGPAVRVGTTLLLAVALAALSVQVPRASTVVAQVPGNTVVQDPIGDTVGVNCTGDPPPMGTRCSLPVGAVTQPWMDIASARITQLGGGRVEMAINLAEPIPPEPPVAFVSYFWQFDNGCIGTLPGPTDKSGVSVVWNGAGWVARWFNIVSCDPRDIDFGDPVPFRFTDDGVNVRVALADVLTEGGATLEWFAGVRRLSSIVPRTFAVDWAPDVLTFNPSGNPFFIDNEPSAQWQQR